MDALVLVRWLPGRGCCGQRGDEDKGQQLHLLRAEKQNNYNGKCTYGLYELVVFRMVLRSAFGGGEEIEEKNPLMRRKPNRGAKKAFRKGIRSA